MLNHSEALAAAKSLVDYLEKLEGVAAVPEPILPALDTGLQKPEAFWDHIRGDKGELFPEITQSQVDGINDTLKLAAGMLPLRWCAYVLATEYHETAKTMVAVREGLNVSDEWRKRHFSYYPWYGRGEIQLTHLSNYKFSGDRLSKLLGRKIDLIANPDLALDPVISTAIMIYGMLEGWFTGKKLNDYINNIGDREQYVNARRIVNGTDRADLIAGYAVEFEKALKKGDWK